MMKILNHLAVLSLIFFFQPLSYAVNVPAGIKHEGYDRLLKKYVDENGLAAYEKRKSNAEDMKGLDDYLAQFAATGNPASGNERYASLVKAYNGLVLRWILKNYATESIWMFKSSFNKQRHKL